MKEKKILPVTFLLAFMLLVSFNAGAQSSLKRKIKRISGVKSVEVLPTSNENTTKFLILFEQPVNHENPKEGKFLQRIFLMHKSFDAPMVMTTEGYAADYANRAGYQDELVKLFDTDQMVVEHRYFGKSVPEKGWKYLNSENAAADHHKIVQSFKKLYKGKWISTGISKGGTTCLIHRVLYPDDVDITIPYVAPINYGVEDGRHESFIATTGSVETREGIRRLQSIVLTRRDSIRSLLENYIEKNELTFEIGIDELIDYMVLEYAFAFYQWGWSPTTIPEENASDEEVFMHFVLVSSPDYFSIESRKNFLPFFVQAAKELGYYGYDIHPFWDLMTITSTHGYLQRIFLPDSLSFTFDLSLTNKVQQYLYDEDPKMIFIYGEWDPWFASAVLFDQRIKKNMLKVVAPAESHSIRISTLMSSQKDEVIGRIRSWLSE